MKKLTAKDIDLIVCQWSMATLAPFTEEQLNSLVDALCAALGISIKDDLQ